MSGSWRGAAYSYQLVLSKFLGHEILINLLCLGSRVINKQLQCLNNRMNMFYLNSRLLFPLLSLFLQLVTFFFFILNSVTSELGWEFCQRPHWNTVFQTSFHIGTSNEMLKLHLQFYLGFVAALNHVPAIYSLFLATILHCSFLDALVWIGPTQVKWTFWQL